MNGARRKTKKAKKVIDEEKDYPWYDAPHTHYDHYHEELEWPVEHKELDWPTDIDANRHTFDYDFMDLGHDFVPVPSR